MSSWRVAGAAALVGALALWGALLAPMPTAGAQPSVPAEPVNVTSTPGDSQVTLAWTPGDDNGSTIIRYEYTYDENGVAVNVWYPIPGSNRHTTGYTVTGLTNGNTYRFHLRAVNYEGNGAVATAVSLPSIPATTPDPVTELIATPGNSQATLTWIPGSDGGSPILYYEFRQRSGDGPYSPWTIMVGSTGATTSYIVTGLTNGVTYWFQVRAVNAIGPTPAPPEPEPEEEEPEEEEPEEEEPEEEEPEEEEPEEEEPEEEEPDTTEPEDDTESEPETTEPEDDTEPEEDESDTTEPEDDTEPEEDESDTTEPEDDTEPEEEEPDTTEPEDDTEPEEDEPDTTEPEDDTEPEEDEPEATEPEDDTEPVEEEPDTTEPEDGTEPDIPVVPPAGGLFYSGVITGPTFCANQSLGGPITYPHDSDDDGVADVCSLPYTRREAIARQQALVALAHQHADIYTKLVNQACAATEGTAACGGKTLSEPPPVPPAGDPLYSGEIITGPGFCANLSLGGPTTYPHDSNGDGVADVCSLPYTRREAIARQQAAITLAATFPAQYRTLLQNSCQALANTDYGDNPADLANDICA
ncbi:fibronectin type III domain-containing protein [Candidatus Poriferisocius sp.]|uniref:fibronectin type III domain-containing protein n=1 Tax=Candidatus Poriferisocius sp. TaxID=3101276 RepID=UPI003B01CE89